jgi:hypothetical protein
MATSAPTGYPSHFARMQHALELRREGKTYREIADLCRLSSENAAQRLISKAIGRVLKETAEEVRQVELSRLELLITTLWDKAVVEAVGEIPDYRKLDRVKGLIEAKLKYCGAVAVLEQGDKHGPIQIFINKFTDAQPAPTLINPPNPTITMNNGATIELIGDGGDPLKGADED